MKTKWSIIVECDAKNLKEFEVLFYDCDDLIVAREFIKGVMMIDENGSFEDEIPS